MTEITKVIIGIPSARGWTPSFGAVAMAMVAHTIAQGNISVYPAIVQGCYISEGRNHLVRIALEAGAHYILFLDDDMTFPIETLVSFLRHDKDIIGAVYNMRTPPHRTAGYPLDPDAGFPREGLLKMKHIPTGIMLVKTEVFKRIKGPWFKYQWRDDEISDMNKDGMIGEDVLFCKRARHAGYEIWADFDISYQVCHFTEQMIKLARPMA